MERKISEIEQLKQDNLGLQQRLSHVSAALMQAER